MRSIIRIVRILPLLLALIIPHELHARMVKHLTTDGAVYPPNIDGVSQYLDTLRYSRPDVYERMKPDVTGFKTMEAISWTLIITGGVLGQGAFWGGYAFYYGSFIATAMNPITGASDLMRNMIISVSLMGGGALITIVAIVGVIILPKDDALDALIRNFNQINNGHELKMVTTLEYGLDISPGRFGVALVHRF